MTEGETGRNHAKQILFVCTANVCRSPIAEAIFNALASDAGVPYEAKSAGVAALKNEPMAPNASVALEEVGVYNTTEQRARQVSGEMLEDADLVLAMGPRHVAKLRWTFGGSLGEVYTLPEYVGSGPGGEEVPDPYGSTMPAYRASMRQLLEYVELLVGRLSVRGGPSQQSK